MRCLNSSCNKIYHRFSCDYCGYLFCESMADGDFLGACSVEKAAPYFWLGAEAERIENRQGT